VPEAVTQDVLWRWTDPPRRGKAVLLVHGFRGDHLDTWRDKGATTSFPELLAQDPALADFDVFVFRYKTSFFSSPRIDNVARQLGDEIRNSLGGYNLVLVAHSMGGLVCMQYILHQLQQQVCPPVLGLLLFGTPTTGVEAIKAARMIFSVAGFKIPGLGLLAKYLSWHRQLADLESASDFLDRLHGEWALRVVNGGSPRAPANGRAWIPVRVVTGNDDWVVSEQAGKGVYGEIDWTPVQYDHRGLVKPASRNDPRYQRAAEFLAQCRSSKPPELLRQLRQFSDEIWGLRDCVLVRNWECELHFHESIGPDSTLLPSPAFGIFEVKRCQYWRVVSERRFVLAMAYGRIAEEEMWKRNPLWVHAIYSDALAEDERGPVSEAIRNNLSDPELAWARFFEGAWIKVAGQDLAQIQRECGDGYAVSTYEVPESLLGSEVVFEFGFKSIRPASLNAFAVKSPYLTLGADIQIVVHGELEFLVATPYFVGGPRPQIQVEEKRKVKIRAADLMLPLSSAQVRWRHTQKGSQP